MERETTPVNRKAVARKSIVLITYFLNTLREVGEKAITRYRTFRIPCERQAKPLVVGFGGWKAREARLRYATLRYMQVWKVK